MGAGPRAGKDSSNPRNTDPRAAHQPAGEMPLNTTAAAPATPNPGLAQLRGSDTMESPQGHGQRGPWHMGHMTQSLEMPHGPGPQKGSFIQKGRAGGSSPPRFIKCGALQAPTMVSAVWGLSAGTLRRQLQMGLDVNPHRAPPLPVDGVQPGAGERTRRRTCCVDRLLERGH